MKRLHDAGSEEILRRQMITPLRIYANDDIQKSRIEKARSMIVRFLEFQAAHTPGATQDFAHKRRTIVELGCGSADISGYFSWGHNCHVWEINPASVEYLTRTYPWINVHSTDLSKAEPMPSDLLILCETLEHLEDPLGICRKWMPLADYCLISSPFDGDLTSDLSAGEHVHSFNELDFKSFVDTGKHQILDTQTFQMGAYRIRMMFSKLGEKDGEPRQNQNLEGGQ